MSTIDQPCVRYDLDEAEYHADPVVGGSLSQSGMKVLLQDGGPARFRWQQDHPTPPTRAMEFGSAAHASILGVGSPWVTDHYGTSRSKEAVAWRAQAKADGVIILSSEDAAHVYAMTDKLRSIPEAVAALEGSHEVSMFTRHDSGVMLRGRADVIGAEGIVDYKTTSKLASPDDFTRSVTTFGYHLQAAHYIAQATELDLCPPRFRFVVQEKTPPYEVGIYELDADFLAIGHDLVERAIQIYAECMESGQWPGLHAETCTLSPPRWLLNQHYSTLDPQLEAELASLISQENAA